MKKQPIMTIRMGAAHWDISVPKADLFIDMRKLEPKQQHRAIFEVVRACRENGLVVT